MIDLAIDSRVFLNRDIDMALQEIDLLFSTTNTELIGYPEFGTNFEQFLWTLTPTTSELQKYINEKLRECYYVNQFKVDTDVEMLTGEIRSIYVVYIEITDWDTNEKRKRVYQFK